MITNFETNKVYLSKGLHNVRYHNGADSLIHLLHQEEIEYAYIPFTESYMHIWARDYMPIQVNNDTFINFRYEPDYLTDVPEYKPNTAPIFEELTIHVIDSDINLDGGNVISCGDKVIMTGKIFKENPHYATSVLIDKLSDLLEAELVIIPWDRYEEYGHADGMVRYMGNGKVLMNNYCDFDKSLRKNLVKALSSHFDITELHLGSSTKKSWAYLNFLHVGNTVYVPFIKDKLQDIAFEQIIEAYPECHCVTVPNYESIVNDGGALNCTTWNIIAKEG